MSQKGQSYLSKNKKQMSLPLLTHTKTFEHPVLNIERRANAVYLSALQEPLRTKCIQQNITQYPIRYNEIDKTFL